MKFAVPESVRVSRRTGWGLTAFITLTGIIAVIRSLHGSNDFDTFYHAGRAVLGGDGIYYSGEYYQTDPNVSPFLYPPFAACFFALFAWLPLVLAAFLWNLVSILCMIGACLLIFQYQEKSFEEVKSFWASLRWADRIFFILVPAGLLLDNLSMSQANILIFFLCVSALLLWKKGRPWAAGLVTAAAFCIKLTPLMLCFFFLAKRSYRAFAGFLAGCLGVLLLTTLVFGPSGNWLFHRQWIGRNVKPALIDWVEKFQKYEFHPLKPTPETYRQMHLTDVMTDRNQSFKSTMTRLFLKDRNQYAYSTAFPIYVAQRFDKLPVLGGGMKLRPLNLLISALQAGLFLFLLILWSRVRNPSADFLALETSVLFLSMTLFAPLARTQQLIFFIFPFQALACLYPRAGLETKRLFLWILRLSAVFYILLAFRYGGAAGMGTWANLTLWAGFVWILIRRPPEFSSH